MHQSLVLEVQGLKQSSTLKSYISFVLFNTFPSRSEYSKKKKVFKIKKKYPTYLHKFFSGCNLNHAYFIWPQTSFDIGILYYFLIKRLFRNFNMWMYTEKYGVVTKFGCPLF